MTTITHSPDPIVLTAEQKAAIEMIKKNSVSILTGGPGTGKTTTIKSILKWTKEHEMSVSMAAASGKAAKRISETTNHPATTIHKLLKARFIDDGFYFEHNENNPLQADMLIVDETSMVDTNLMAELLRAVEIGTKVLFIGDQDQLPSVGSGAVFRDFLASKKIPTTTLNIIHRNSGAIIKACHAIKHGQDFIPPDTLNPDSGDNFRHIEENNQTKIIGIIRAVVSRMIKRGYDPLWDIQILSPLNKRTVMSCENINKVMQDAINPNPIIENYQFRIADKVINTKNEKIDDATFIVNGDLGQILDIQGGKLTVKFFYPERVVELSKIENNLLLAYSCTVHRYQGSEVPVVILPIHKSFGYFVNRPLIYTAISRAQQILITVGQFSAFKAAVKRTQSQMRTTMLKPQLAI